MKLDSEPVVNARAERVEGWQKYYEYFHLLDADMQGVTPHRMALMFASSRCPQKTSSVSKRRYGSDKCNQLTDTASACVIRARKGDDCFEEIMSQVKKLDKPLVRLATEDDEGKDLKIDEATGVRILGQSDLEAVQKQLRAAAISSNQRANSAAAVDDLSPAELAAEVTARQDQLHEYPCTLEARLKHAYFFHFRAVASELDGIQLPVAPLGGSDGALGDSDPSTCSAAIETLLWFGLALGEKPQRKGGKKGAKARARKAEEMLMQLDLESSFSSPASTAASDPDDPCEFTFEWEGAIREAGLVTEQEAEEALRAVRALEAAESGDATLPALCAPRVSFNEDWDDSASNSGSSAGHSFSCLLYTSPSPRDGLLS
eukprot:6204130-Pleurochrysis_carterae.AAC.6